MNPGPETPPAGTQRADLELIFRAAVNAADPARVLAGHLPPRPEGRVVVVGAGKAAASMALALEREWGPDLDGLVVTRYGHGLETASIEVVEAAHPVPDDAGLAVARRMLEKVSGLSPSDSVVFLVSGGGSALLSLPADGVTAGEKRQVNSLLLKSGAAIDEINTVRKHLSAIKGGRLALAASPARVITLAISDVPGDDPATIASGPTVADPTTFADARAVLEKYSLDVPPAVTARLEGSGDETPKPGDPRLGSTSFTLIATPMLSLRAAEQKARELGYEPRVLGDDIEGEASEIGWLHARMALDVAGSLKGGERVALISGGETTVSVKGDGRGGRNVEYLLGLALELDGHPGISAIACDTDGIDGTEDNAGAVYTADSMARAGELGLDGAAFLANNDAYSFFSRLGDLVITGPTLTNVNDFRCILIG